MSNCFPLQVLVSEFRYFCIKALEVKRSEKSVLNTCCTPSPPTSRRLWIPGTQLILSTSSRNTIPRKRKIEKKSLHRVCSLQFACNVGHKAGTCSLTVDTAVITAYKFTLLCSFNIVSCFLK